jgi:Tfp pilus assembly protein PilF
MPHHIHRADRFLYLPLAGLAAAIAAGLMALARAGKGLAAAGALGLLLLGLLSARQVWTWRNSCTVWAHCVQAQPDNSAAQEAFAELLAAHGDPRRAMIHYRRAVELDFNDPEMLRVRALQCASREDDPTRNYQEALQLATRACELAHWRNPTCLRALAAIHTILGGFLAESGEFRGAMEHYRRAMEMDTEFDAPLYNLASLLANCPDENLRRPEEAVRLARQACELTKQPSANHLKILAQAYAAAGRFDMAAAKAQEGADRAQDAGDSQAADELRKWANQYRSPIRKK